MLFLVASHVLVCNLELRDVVKWSAVFLLTGRETQF